MPPVPLSWLCGRSGWLWRDRFGGAVRPDLVPLWLWADLLGALRGCLLPLPVLSFFLCCGSCLLRWLLLLLVRLCGLPRQISPPSLVGAYGLGFGPAVGLLLGCAFRGLLCAILL